MNATSLAVSVQSTDGLIVGVDLAKNVFQLCVADARWRPVEAQRLSRAQFERWFANRAVSRVLMEACGSAHHWARWLTGLGIEVTLLPARYVRAYVNRNKTDAADAAALLEAARCADLHPVRIKVSVWAWHLEMTWPVAEHRDHGVHGGGLGEDGGGCHALAQRRRAGRVHSQSSGSHLGAAPGVDAIGLSWQAATDGAATPRSDCSAASAFG